MKIATCPYVINQGSQHYNSQHKINTGSYIKCINNLVHHFSASHTLQDTLIILYAQTPTCSKSCSSLTLPDPTGWVLQSHAARPYWVGPLVSRCQTLLGGSSSPTLPDPTGWVLQSHAARPYWVGPLVSRCQTLLGGSSSPTLPDPTGWL